jgi:hypothetical protein
MEEFNIQGKQTSFYEYCPGTFGYILVNLEISKPTHVMKKFIENLKVPK